MFFISILLLRYSPPTVPSFVANTSIVGNSVDAAGSILAFVNGAFVDVDRTIVLVISRRTVADVAVKDIVTVSGVLAICLKTQSTTYAARAGFVERLKRQVFHRGEVCVSIDLVEGEVVEKHAAYTNFAETAFEGFTCKKILITNQSTFEVILCKFDL